MATKKLSHQQKNRILKKQQGYSLKECLSGLVITRTQNKAMIESDDGVLHLCMIRPDIESLVVGDKVLWQVDKSGHGVVVSVLPRLTELSRYDRFHKLKILAANITQMVVVVAPLPEPSTLLIDSYLVAAELIGVKLSIVFNKTDLDKDHALETILNNDYKNLCHRFTAHQKSSTDLHFLKQLLENEVSVFVGQSGVGKSTLINQLLPNQNIPTLPLSNTHEFGQHTTSSSIYYHLPFGGAIIDSPGVRGFGLWHLKLEDLLWGFKDFRPFIGKCKFRDCKHQDERYCAILQAVKNQEISHKRYESYVKLIQQFTADT